MLIRRPTLPVALLMTAGLVGCTDPISPFLFADADAAISLGDEDQSVGRRPRNDQGPPPEVSVPPCGSAPVSVALLDGAVELNSTTGQLVAQTRLGIRRCTLGSLAVELTDEAFVTGSNNRVRAVPLTWVSDDQLDVPDGLEAERVVQLAFTSTGRVETATQIVLCQDPWSATVSMVQVGGTVTGVRVPVFCEE